MWEGKGSGWKIQTQETEPLKCSLERNGNDCGSCGENKSQTWVFLEGAWSSRASISMAQMQGEGSENSQKALY